ncbi:uncharacterized protein LOC126816065 isoform X2 [Patella vulgata]|uniref:uncharacterized protein LOC126816065 isoform X2 n=1 Tax=Patella vulgata TaxID=6465 RepID=UPI00218029D1|nr:uncharacterized protein LOC126816065 isoform X2 [Patella vulgata]
MNNDVASKFINSIVKNLQLLCHSDVNFNENVEIIGHLYLNVDSNSKYNYFVNEKVCKNDESSTVFVSNSFHAEPVKKPSLCETNDKNIGEFKNVNKQTDQRKNWSDSRQRKTERIKHGTPKNMDSFSDDDMPPAKHAKLRIEMPIQSDTRFGSSSFEKKVKSEFDQFNISFNNNARVHQDNASQYSTSSPHLSDNKHLADDSCIDLTDIKNEPSDNDDSEYIKSQQHIIDQGDTSYMTDDESLSTFSGSNEQILNLYTTAVSQNEPHCSLNNFTHLPLSANTDKMLFPPLPQTVHGSSTSAAGREDASNKITDKIQMVTIDGVVKYKCPSCTSVLSTKHKLHRHYNEKHLNVRCVCNICGSLFTQRSSLKRHILSCHSDLIS